MLKYMLKNPVHINTVVLCGRAVGMRIRSLVARIAPSPLSELNARVKSHDLPARDGGASQLAIS